MTKTTWWTPLVLSFFAWSFPACEAKRPTTMIIKGHLAKADGQKIYLTDAYQWDKLLDSTTCKNGEFTLNPDPRMPEPFLASLATIKSDNGIKQFLMINYLKTTPKDTFKTSAFMLSYGVTEVAGEYDANHPVLSIKPNDENDLHFRSAPVNKTSIENHPQSYFLLQKLYQNRGQFKKNTLTTLLALFDSAVLSGESGRLVREYGKFLNETGNIRTATLFPSAAGRKVELFNDPAQLHMLVFWASWCGPCRMEIPQLKKLYAEVDKNKVAITSVSIDEDPENWRRALAEEKMRWQQLLIPKADLFQMKAFFGINSIPVVIFTDKNGTVLKRFVGYQPSNFEEYRQSISRYLKPPY